MVTKKEDILRTKGRHLLYKTFTLPALEKKNIFVHTDSRSNRTIVNPMMRRTFLSLLLPPKSKSTKRDGILKLFFATFAFSSVMNGIEIVLKVGDLT